MDLVLKKDPNQNNWPSLVKFDVGNDGIIEWYEPFYTIGSRYPMDFSGALNKFIRSLSNPFTAIAIASVPINISSASAGTIDMNNIEIVVEPNVSDPLDPDTDTDGVLDGNEASAGTGRLDVDSDNDGVFDGLEQTTGGSSAQVTTTDDSDDLLVYTNLNGGSRVVNISLPVSTQNVPGHITSAAMNLTGQIYISGQFPMNVAFDVGNDGVPEWSYTGSFSTTASVPDFSGPLNNYTVNNPNLINSTGYIDIPIAISSSTDGNLSMSGIMIQIDPDYSNPLVPDTDSDELSDGDELQLGTGRSDADSDNDFMTDGYEVEGGGQTYQDPLIWNKDFAFHITVSFDFRMNQSYLDKWIKGMRNFSNYLYDSTEGYMHIGSVEFYDNKQNWADADFKVYYDASQLPGSWISVRDSTVHLSRYFNGNNLMSGDPDQLPYTAMLAHEFSHYRFYVLDEYRNSALSSYYWWNVGDGVDEAPKTLMNNPVFLSGYTYLNTTEYSTPGDYANYNSNYNDFDTNTADDDLDTEQYINNNFMSCWETIFKNFNSANGTYMPMVDFDFNKDNVPDTEADINTNGIFDVLESYTASIGPTVNVGANMSYKVHFSPLQIPSWYHETRLTTALGGAHSPKLAASGNNIHLTFWDTRNTVGGSAIFYKSSTNSGLTWSTDVQVSQQSNSGAPEIAVSANFVHFVWMAQVSPSNYEIFYRNYDTMMSTFSPETKLTNDGNLSLGPKIAVSGMIVHIIWLDQMGAGGLYYMNSTDGGFTWNSPVLLATSISGWYDFVTFGTDVHVVWSDKRHVTDWNNPNIEIYYRNSTNSGISWNPEIRITNESSVSNQPAIANSANKLNVFWFDARVSFAEIYYNSTTLGTGSWNAGDMPIITWPTSNPSSSFQAAANGTYLHLTWMDGRDGWYNIYYNYSADEGSNWQQSDRQITVTQSAMNPDIVVTGGKRYIVWEDVRQGFGWSEIYLRYF
jgi:hypothetical protein